MATQIIKIELMTSTVCPACFTIKERLRTVIEGLDQTRINFREIDVLENLDYAVELGVLSMPAIVINGKLAFSSVPSLKKLRDVLQRYLQRLD